MWLNMETITIYLKLRILYSPNASPKSSTLAGFFSPMSLDSAQEIGNI
jgi:hypothetical protein